MFQTSFTFYLFLALPPSRLEPEIDDIKQGNVRDCVLLSSLSSIVKKYPEYIKKIIFNDPSDKDNYAIVRLFDNDGQECYYRVPKVRLKNSGATDSATWVQVFEIAYAYHKKFNKEEDNGNLLPTNNTKNKLKCCFSVQLNRAYAKNVLFHICGKTPDLIKFQKEKYIDSETTSGSGIYTYEAEKFFNLHKRNVNFGEVLFIAGTSNKHGHGIYDNHEYAVLELYNFKSSSGKNIKMIRLRNPWGSNVPKYAISSDLRTLLEKNRDSTNGTFNLDLNDFFKYFTELAYSTIDLDA